MNRYVLIAGILCWMLPCAPSFAVTAKDKMATCKFGADDQKLQGAGRAAFMQKCMSSKNDPRGAGPAPVRAAVPPPAGGMPPPPQH